MLGIGLGNRLRCRAGGNKPLPERAERRVGGHAHVRNEHVDRHSPSDFGEEPLERGRHVERAPREQSQAVEPLGIGDA